MCQSGLHIDCSSDAPCRTDDPDFTGGAVFWVAVVLIGFVALACFAVLWAAFT